MRMLFVSFMGGGCWGGSEELWSQTALHLHALGHRVSGSVYRFPQTAADILALKTRGIAIQERSRGRPSLLNRTVHRLKGSIAPDAELFELHAWIRHQRPDFICVSNGVGIDMLDGLELVSKSGIPWCNISQCGIEWFWPTNEEISRAEPLFKSAARWFFVSEANKRLFETQWGVSLPEGEVVRNPYKVAHETDLPWPDDASGLRLACVSRLDPICKGQDILIEALAQPAWQKRPFTLSLFGGGDRSLSIQRLIKRFELKDRVIAHGHVSSIEDIWKYHHLLVMPSRHEGLPLALVEAMLCGRPALATDVGGNRELIQEGQTGFLADAPTVSAVSSALERAWSQRSAWRTMGAQARAHTRKLIPADPVGLFARRLLDLASSRH